MDTTKRIYWIDVLRFLGIFAIYLGHLGNQAGYFYPFVFRYQVPLFFFISGAMEVFTKTDTTFVQYFRKKFKAIVLPYFFFGLVSIVLIFLEGNATVGLISETVIQYLLGIRNRLFAPALWFLPCLFVISILFFVLKKIINNRWLLLLLGMVLLTISETLLPHRPIIQPSWFWNIDSALYYLFYFALGYALFPFISQLLSSRSNWARWSVIASATLVTVYAGTLLIGKDLLAIGLKHIPNSGSVIHVLGAMCLIWFNVILAQLLSSITICKQLGRDTLFLCGSEQVIRHITPPLVSLLGWNIEFLSPLGAIIYTFTVLLAAKFGIIPFLKSIYSALPELISPALYGAPDNRSY